MADGEIKIDTKVDTSGLDKGLKDMNNKLGGAGKTLDAGAKKGKGFADNLKGISTRAVAAAGTVAGVAVAVKKTVDALNDCAAAYRVQAKAETQLETAAKNNPYLLSSSVSSLKNYASELQSISTIGDEEIIPFMAQLASAGRTQEEIQDIMKVSVDIAASGSMSLESAVRNLNKTYGGYAGELGETIPQVKALSAEQLKNGEAVKVLGAQYDGMAKEVSKATGTSEQLKNAVGDLKEEMGAHFEKAMSPIRAFFTELISGWADAKRAKREYYEAVKAAETGTQTASQEELIIKKEESQLTEQQSDFDPYQKLIEGYTGNLKTSTKEFRNAYNDYQMAVGSVTPEEYIEKALKPYIKVLDEQKEKIEALKTEYNRLKEAEEAAAEAARKEEAAAQKAAALQEEVEARDKLRATYDETLRQKQEEINQRRITGERISEEAEAQEMYNTAFAAYIKMMSDPAFAGNSGNYSHETNARAQIADWGKIAGGDELKKQIKDFEQELQAAADEANGIVKTQYSAILESLDAEYNAVIENKYLEEEEKTRIQEDYAKKRKEIEAAAAKADKDALNAKIDAVTGINENYWTQYKAKLDELAKLEKEVESSTVLDHDEKEAEKTRLTEAAIQARKDLISNIANDVANYTSQAVQIMKDASNLMLDTVKNNATAEQAELEIKYRKGEIGEEEYNEKLTESKRKAAKEQYKIQMIQWSASIMQATANTALGVTQSIAEGGAPVGIIMGALAAAAGAVQIASIIASKPTPPNFSTGGIIGGSSTHGDNIAANLNSREMIMNMGQQKALWDFINGGGNGGGNGANIVINNSASNIATAQPKITRDKIEIMIDARVNDSMKRGRYDQSLNMAQQGMSGDYYGI